jgi:hypothetical protein
MDKMVLSLALAAFVVIGSCAYIGCSYIEGNGNVVKEARVLGSFSKIEISGAFDVDITCQKSKQELDVETDDNLLSYVITKIESDTLHIYTKSNYTLRPSNRIKLTISMQEIELLDSAGSSNINITNINSGSFAVDTSGSDNITLKGKPRVLKIESSGSSDITCGVTSDEISVDCSGSAEISLVGTATKLSIDTSGSSQIFAGAMMAKHVSIDISGSGSARVRAEETLEVDISGSADVAYLGNPERVVQRTSGSGRITKVSK